MAFVDLAALGKGNRSGAESSSFGGNAAADGLLRSNLPDGRDRVRAKGRFACDRRRHKVGIGAGGILRMEHLGAGETFSNELESYDERRQIDDACLLGLERRFGEP